MQVNSSTFSEACMRWGCWCTKFIIKWVRFMILQKKSWWCANDKSNSQPHNEYLTTSFPLPAEISYISSSSRGRGDYGSRPKSLPGAPQPSGGTPGAPAPSAEQREWTESSKDTRQRPHRSRSRTRGLALALNLFMIARRLFVFSRIMLRSHICDFVSATNCDTKNVKKLVKLQSTKLSLQQS